MTKLKIIIDVKVIKAIKNNINRMAYKNKKPVLFASLLFVFCMLFSFSLQPQSASALNRPDALRECNIKRTEALKKSCVTKVNACQPQNTNACLTKAATPGKLQVLAVCKDRPNPQNCQQRVVTGCQPGTEPDIAECRQRLATLPDSNKEFEELSLNALNGAGKKDTCGGADGVATEFDFGCTGKGGAIQDLAYAIVRFLSIGVGLVLVASVIYAGISYSAAEGNPENTAAAKRRIINTMIGLAFYLLIFALIQYLVPGGLFYSA